MTRTSIVFGASGSWSTAPTQEIENPLKKWRREYLAGYAQAVRDHQAGNLRQTFGSFATTAFAMGYRDAAREVRS